MAKFHINTCPVCNGTVFNTHGEVKDMMVSKESFKLLKCNGCGLILTQDTPAEEEISTYYKSDIYISHSDTKEGLINRLYHRARRIMLGRKRRLFENLPISSKRLLDIGAGTGYFAHHMQEHGWQISAIEPDEEARLFMKKQFGINAAPSSSLYHIEKGSYSVISMWHVLEHVYDLEKYLQTIYDILCPDGYFVIALPNPDCYDAEKQGWQWSAWDVPRHIWHFNPAVTENLLGKYGFELERKVVMPFDGFYNALKTYILTGDRLAYLKGPLIGLLAYLKGVINPDKASSLIYVAKKIPLSSDIGPKIMANEE